MKRAKLGEN